MKICLTIIGIWILFLACSTPKKQVIPEIAPEGIPEVTPPLAILIDSFIPELQHFSEFGIIVKSSDFSSRVVENILQTSSMDWLVLFDTLGIKHLFSHHVILEDKITFATEENLHPGKLSDLLKFYNAQLGIVIDPSIDLVSDLDGLITTLKSWEIPVAHWRIGYLPHLKTGPFTWTSGDDFAEKTKLYSEKILSAYPGASIYLAGGSDQYNVFTDQMLDKMSGGLAKQGICLTNFNNLVKSNYFTSSVPQYYVLNTTHRTGSSQLEHLIRLSLGLAGTQNVKSVAWEILLSDLQSTRVLQTFEMVKLILKNAGFLRQSVGLTDKSLAIFTASPKNDTSELTMLINLSEDSVSVDVNHLGIKNQKYYTLSTFMDTMALPLPQSEVIRLAPGQFIGLGNLKRFLRTTKSPADLFVTQINVTNSSSIYVSWPPVKDAQDFRLEYGLNRGKPDRILNSSSLGLAVDSLRAGRSYYFKFSALDSNGVKLISDEFNYDVIPPKTPYPPVMSEMNNKLVLSWHPVPYASQYTIRQFNHGLIKETTVPGDVHEIVYDGLMDQSSYLFAIKAGNTLGESEFSRTGISVVQKKLGPPPFKLQKSGEKLSWQDTISETRTYNLYSGNSIENLKIIRSAIADTFYLMDQDSTFPVNGYLAVKASDRFGESRDFSNLIQLRPVIQTPTLYIFDAYSSGDSTNYIIRFEGPAPDRASLILQNRTTEEWQETRYDLGPYLSETSKEYRLSLPNTATSKFCLASAIYGSKRIYSKLYVLQ